MNALPNHACLNYGCLAFEWANLPTSLWLVYSTSLASIYCFRLYILIYENRTHWAEQNLPEHTSSEAWNAIYNWCHLTPPGATSGHLRLIYSFFSSPPCSDPVPSLMDFTTVSLLPLPRPLHPRFAVLLNNLTWLSENCETGVVQPASLCALSRAEETCATATEH